MNYQDYQNARDAAWRILLDCGVDALPVEISRICRQLGISVKLYIPEDDNDGMCFLLEGKPVILVSALAPPERQRFTCAHELGHIVLGHLGTAQPRCREPDLSIEHAANVFASRLLAPACVLWGCGAVDADSIADICGISRQSAAFRAERMQKLMQRGRFLSSPLEREVYRRFETYMKEYIDIRNNTCYNKDT